MNAVQHEVITAGAGFATAEELVLTDVDQNERKAFFLRVLTGTIKVGVNDVTANAHGWTSSDTVPPISCKNGELQFTAAASTDTFILSASPA